MAPRLQISIRSRPYVPRLSRLGTLLYFTLYSTHVPSRPPRHELRLRRAARVRAARAPPALPAIRKPTMQNSSSRTLACASGTLLCIASLLYIRSLICFKALVLSSLICFKALVLQSSCAGGTRGLVAQGTCAGVHTRRSSTRPARLVARVPARRRPAAGSD
jgi:hypothetical protein